MTTLRAMPRAFSLLLSLALLLGCSGCNLLHKFKSKPKTEAKAPEGPTVIGSIELVNPEARFVVVHLLANVPIAPGTELFTMGASGRTAKLKVTPERKTVFITADVTSGEPQKGDAVLRGPATAAPAATPAATPAGPSSATNPNSLPVAPGAIPATAPIDPLPLPTQDGNNLRPVPSGVPN
jgi:hypothetical protein